MYDISIIIFNQIFISGFLVKISVLKLHDESPLIHRYKFFTVVINGENNVFCFDFDLDNSLTTNKKVEN